MFKICLHAFPHLEEKIVSPQDGHTEEDPEKKIAYFGEFKVIFETTVS
jgi:hypothetical protein